VRKLTIVTVRRLGGIASTRLICSARSGQRSAAQENSEWIAVSRRLRVWMPLLRSCSR
jgi:hypothetical protein